jgi:ferrous iron transport protein A
MTLDQLPIGKRARIVTVDWSRLVDEEAQRLRALGLDAGARVAVAHRGVFAGRDPLAAMVVDPVPDSAGPRPETAR